MFTLLLLYLLLLFSTMKMKWDIMFDSMSLQGQQYENYYGKSAFAR